MQSLGSTDLVLKVPSTELGVYSEFNEVAFLVNQWIKIQDSLEMVFNLISGNSTRSLEILAYLRRNLISSYEFATYLFVHRRVVLVNRFTDAKSNPSTRYSQLNKIKELVSDLEYPCHYLIVGERPKTTIEKWSNVLEVGVVYHTSGVVLNNYSNEYYETWYALNDQACKDKTPNFSLRNFQRL
ncbi:hypothetical protein F0249_20075 [Vibrio sp. 03-59-1]|uniref:hypothetical protein n=1 Tax=Vibrio sp. 03-59-1 TaxID=2607607 RepID=UPI001493DC28|nr:hypothetical protein [Vibrio sp. 03-59-1]NOH86067.1 hypothetical protein [Vibrio sp. 03-59-1]